MDSLQFFPTATDELLKSAGCCSSEYEFSYLLEGYYRPLRSQGKRTIKLVDEQDQDWKIENEGLRFVKKVKFEYSDVLMGKNGIACKDAEVGLGIIWTNKELSQMGTILPRTEIRDGGQLEAVFDYEFHPGMIQGNLLLETILYIKKAANIIEEDEASLMNETGVTVGLIDDIVINTTSTDVDFPIEEVNLPGKPLWWLRMEQWDDPTVDTFTPDNICLYLNSAYSYCPRAGDTIKNSELLVEIFSTAYFMIFLRLREMQYETVTIDGTNLEPGSICEAMNHFIGVCEECIQFNSLTELQRTIHQNIQMLLEGGANN